jgi:hypothetical protein
VLSAPVSGEPGSGGCGHRQGQVPAGCAGGCVPALAACPEEGGGTQRDAESSACQVYIRNRAALCWPMKHTPRCGQLAPGAAVRQCILPARRRPAKHEHVVRPLAASIVRAYECWWQVQTQAAIVIFGACRFFPVSSNGLPHVVGRLCGENVG